MALNKDDSGQPAESGILGKSQVMRDLLRELRAIGRTDAPVLIEGETGVGKSLMARTLHRWGSRAAQPFVALNAANLSEELFESELFGHVKGAFSGAYENHKGLARAADRGTLFLDEVGELKASCQAKLLSFLDRQEVRPVGGLRSTKVDLRVISATHRNLRQLIRESRFRRDLYYRLRVLTLRVPSLRERRDDLPLLAAHFLGKLCRKYGKQLAGISEAALAALAAHPWEGNVRELENEIERAVILTPEGREIQPRAFSLVSESGNHLQPMTAGARPEVSPQPVESRPIRYPLPSQRWELVADGRIPMMQPPTRGATRRRSRG